MQGVKDVMLIVNGPLPVPLVSLLPEVVGPEEVPQHTPLCVTVDAQLPEIFPPVETEVEVCEVNAVVETDGKTEAVVNVISDP